MSSETRQKSSNTKGNLTRPTSKNEPIGSNRESHNSYSSSQLRLVILVSFQGQILNGDLTLDGATECSYCGSEPLEKGER